MMVPLNNVARNFVRPATGRALAHRWEGQAVYRRHPFTVSHSQSNRNSLSPVQSTSPLAPIGVNAAIEAARDSNVIPKPKIFDEFSLKDRVGIVSGGNRGIGLEAALALCEAGASAIYCFDLPASPSKDWEHTRDFVKKMGNGSRLEYVSADVRDQTGLWQKTAEIGDKEGRLDVCVASAGIIGPVVDCTEYPDEGFKAVLDVNTNGVLYTAQAAGRQMIRFGNRGSIILIASVAGSLSIKDISCISYHTSKSAVLQMARSMACELGKKNIRVNSLSPGYIYTGLTVAYTDMAPHVLEDWSSENPMGRLGRPDELRGVVTWLASDASSFCTGSDILITGGHHSW